MRAVKRIKPLLKQIEDLWLKCPDMRLTQLLSNAAIAESDWSDNDLYHLEDDKLSDAILKYHLKHHNQIKIDYKNRSDFALEEMIRFGVEAQEELEIRADEIMEKAHTKWENEV